MIVCKEKVVKLVQKFHEYYSNKDSNTLAIVNFAK